MRTPEEEYNSLKAQIVLLGWRLIYKPLHWVLYRALTYGSVLLKELRSLDGHYQEYVDSL